MGLFSKDDKHKEASKLAEDGLKKLTCDRDYASALPLLKKALKKDPGNKEASHGLQLALVWLAWVESGIGTTSGAIRRGREALTAAEKDLASDPSCAFALHIKEFSLAYLGLVYESFGYPSDARELYGKAAKIVDAELEKGHMSKFALGVQALLPAHHSQIGSAKRRSEASKKLMGLIYLLEFPKESDLKKRKN